VGNIAEITSEELICRCANERSDDLWEEFLRRYRPYLTRVVYRASRSLVEVNISELDDLVQEVLLQLWADDAKLLRSFNYVSEPAFLAYLKIVAIHTAHDHLRARKALKRGGEVVSVPLDQIEAMDRPHNLDDRLLISQVERFLNSYPVRERSVFWLHYRHGFSMKAIGNLPDLEMDLTQVAGVLRRLTRHVYKYFLNSTTTKNADQIRLTGGVDIESP
jgi:RNA polymerase sigma-70 factor (ECF subfamily)